LIGERHDRHAAASTTFDAGVIHHLDAAGQRPFHAVDRIRAGHHIAWLYGFHCGALRGKERRRQRHLVGGAKARRSPGRRTHDGALGYGHSFVRAVGKDHESGSIPLRYISAARRRGLRPPLDDHLHTAQRDQSLLLVDRSIPAVRARRKRHLVLRGDGLQLDLRGRHKERHYPV